MMPQRLDELEKTKLSALKQQIWKMSSKYKMSEEDTSLLVSLVDAENDKLDNIKYAMSEIMSRL